MRTRRLYTPGSKPFLALAALVHTLRVTRSAFIPDAKAGLTLLTKQGFARESSPGVWAPDRTVTTEGTENFWSLIERLGLTEDGYATDYCRDIAHGAYKR